MDNLLLKVAKQLPQLKAEQLLIRKLQFKLSNQMRSIKTFHALRKLYSLIDILIEGCRQILLEKTINISHIKEVKHLNHLVVHLAPLVQEFIKRHFLVQFHLILLGIIARIYYVSKEIMKNLELIQSINQSKVIIIQDEPDYLISPEQEYSLIESQEAEIQMTTLPDIIPVPPKEEKVEKNNNMVELLFADIKINNQEKSTNNIFDLIKLPNEEVQNKSLVEDNRIDQNQKMNLKQTFIDDIFEMIKLTDIQNEEPQNNKQQQVEIINKPQEDPKINSDPPYELLIEESGELLSHELNSDQQVQELEIQTDKILKNLKIKTKRIHKKLKYKYFFKQLRKRYLLK